MAKPVRRIVTGRPCGARHWRAAAAPRHPAIHRTRTVDYVIVLEGEITLPLDDAELLLKAGDVVVQQPTNHAWINRGSAICRLGMVFIDADEPEQILQMRKST
jgi:uncharacterized cupin superfamily protein